MLTLLNEVHFWTLRDDIDVPHSDFGVFRYYDKKASGESAFGEGKKLYAEKRGMQCVLTNKRPYKLKDSLRELEDCLFQQRIILSQWRDSALLQIVFSSGLLVNIFVNIHTGDVVNIVFDKFLIGKLLSDYVVGAVLTKSHLICAYNDNQLTVVYFTKPALKRSTPKSLNRLDPKIHTLELAGPPGRRLERKITCNVSGDMILVWWHSSQDEVFPWSPHFKEEDRANILIYGISGIKSELLCHHKSEHDPLCVTFSHTHSNILHCVEQKVSRKGEVTVENAIYEVHRFGLQRLSMNSIPLPTHVCCQGFSPGQDKLLIGCIDGSLVLFDQGRGITHTVKAAFIPSFIAWHPEGAVIFVGNERAQLQVLDTTLSSIRQQALGEDGSPSNILDLATNLRGQPTLHKLLWAKKSDSMIVHAEKYAPMDSLLLVILERGPLAVLRLVGGGGVLGDVHGGGGLSVDFLIAQYLRVNGVDRAIALLQTLNWDTHGSACLSALYRITNYLFKRPLTQEREDQLQAALGTFHLPERPMCPATVEEFAAPLRDLTRRFFHHLLRYHLFDKAFRLAIDLQCRDLFLDIHFSARQAGLMDLAATAYSKAEDLDRLCEGEDSVSTHSECSRSSCSECSSASSSAENGDNQVPSQILRRGSHRTSLRQRRRPVGRSGSDLDSFQVSARRRKPEVVRSSSLGLPPVTPISFAITVPSCAAPIATATNISVDPSSVGLNYDSTSLRVATTTSTTLVDSTSFEKKPELLGDDYLDFNLNPVTRSGSLTVCDYPTSSSHQQQHLKQILLNHFNNYQQPSPNLLSVPSTSSTSLPSLSRTQSTSMTTTMPWHNVPPETQTRVHEKPKVKFSDTVLQITVPERLHTVLEEVEDPLPYRSLPDSLNSYNGSLKSRASTNSLPRQNYHNEKPLPSSPSSFTFSSLPPSTTEKISTHETNHLPSTLPCFTFPSSPPSTAEKISNHETNHQPSTVPYFSLPLSQPLTSEENPTRATLQWVTADSTKSTNSSRPLRTDFYDPNPSSLNRALNSRSFGDMPTHDRFAQQLSFKSSPSEQQVRSSRPDFEEVPSNVWTSPWNGAGDSVRIEPWSLDVPGDSLECNQNLELEFSSLLPGSRKTIAPSINGRPSVVSLKTTPEVKKDSNSHIKSMNISDLSEEEENNGTIKVVHFGVV